ncbi:hypothetical protein ES332_D03G193400v1 [Gossypium tomentosum]|uniref:Uncharacterized protein n=1 Tax=Gossypium tomentosum TaxID=34277 RepID=A0A5D2LQV3_GOSTO|nr:hypothetical protein ES332_D03G193400v1 [Gossypium tomentosum]
MALSQSNHDSKIFVSATPYNVYKDDQSLESPFITFKFNIKMSYVLDKPDKSVPSYISKHDSWHEFEHPVDELTRGFICSLFVDAKIPFALKNLHWKKHDFDKESIPLVSTDCVVSSILVVCSDMINAARESGRKKLFLLVMIKKQVVVPRDEYLAMLKAKEGQEVLCNVEDMIRLQARGWNFQRSDWEDMANVVRRAGLGDSIKKKRFGFSSRTCYERTDKTRFKSTRR